jgi:N-acetylglucosamine kinase-like BadF-type ATPase
MMLIADSGSSKTDWLLTDKDNLKKLSYSTAGFNPMTQTPAFIEGEIAATTDLLAYSPQITSVHFFGAGCSSKDRNAIISNILSKYFPNAEVIVDHDIAGAILATCSGEPGFACILGTGSNAVLFDGQKIIYPKGFLGIGYILGDEGSGSFMGKQLLRDYLYKRLPDDIENHLTHELGLDKDKILNAVYKTPNANKYLASFAQVLNMFNETPYVKELVKNSFDAFLKYNIASFPEYKTYKVNFVGSIALHFQVTLREVCKEYGVELGRIVHRPVENIAAYLMEKG